MSFSRHWKALWVTLRWVFATIPIEKLSQTHGWEFRLRGFECKKKKKAELFDAACGEPEICDFFSVKALQKNKTLLTQISASVSTLCRGSGAWSRNGKPAANRQWNSRHVRLFPFYAVAKKMEKKNSKNKEQLLLSSIFFSLAKIKKKTVSKQELYCRQWGQRQQASRKERKISVCVYIHIHIHIYTVYI